MPRRAHPLRVGCVQYDPKIGEDARNAAKVKELTAGLGRDELDLLVLPEMAVTGYCFKSAEEIAPFLESQQGTTYDLSSDLAKRLGCYVVAGYPERLPRPGERLAPEGERLPSAPSSTSAPASTSAASSHTPGNEAPPPFDAPPPAEDGVIASEAPEAQLAIPPPSHLPPSFDEAMAASGTKGRGVGYNSALLVDPSGELVGNYRKAFLYDADRPWALEGPGFRYFDLPQPLGRLVVGVCMDLNPKDFLAPWNAYELSGFAKRVGADTLVVPMNWLEPELDESDLSDEEREELENLKGSEHPCLSNLNYWAARCTPLHDPSPGYAAEDGGDAPGEGGGGGEEVVFVATNRSGEERGTTFSGSSAVMRFGPGVELVEALSRGKEGVLIAHVL